MAEIVKNLEAKFYIWREMLKIRRVWLFSISLNILKSPPAVDIPLLHGEERIVRCPPKLERRS